MALFHVGTLHWLWIGFVGLWASVGLHRVPLSALGLCRWICCYRRRKTVKQYYALLADHARRAGHSGPLTTSSTGQLTFRHFLHRPILDAMPALVSSTDSEKSNSYLNIRNFAALQRAAAEGKGVVIGGTHFGSLGISAALVAKQGYPVVILRDQQFARLLHTPHAQQFFLGAEPVFIDGNDPASATRVLMRCARALKDGAVIGYTLDAGHGTRSATCTLFGRQVELRTALLDLAMQTGSSIIYGFSFVEGSKIQVELSKPTRINSKVQLEQWYHNFCHQWQQMLLNHPGDISWSLADVKLLGQKLA